jgi:RimJ/RimL family protein N-acetyltransferase
LANPYSYKNFSGLDSPRLKLQRLQLSDFEEIISTLFSPTSWVCAFRGIDTREKMLKYLEVFVDKQNREQGLTLVARIKNSNEIAGISSYHSAPENFARVEIGYTWIADRWMRTFVNTEMKLLMISYAFEVMKVRRVEFSVDPRNEKSNTAMKRIGAQYEGTLRKWRFLNESDPGSRNIYSIIDEEWPETRLHIEKLAQKPWP